MTESTGRRGTAGAVDALLADLAALDIRLEARDGKLAYDAPQGRFNSELKARVAALKPALLARLSSPAATGSSVVTAPLSPGQERMWFLNRLEVGPGALSRGSYTEHLVFECLGPLDRSALETGLNLVAARHGALRTLFREGATGPEQIVSPGAPASFSVVDLSAAPSLVESALERAAHRPIDLAVDPHVHVTLFVLGADRHILSVSAHHAAWDGWSNGVFATDLAAAYNALASGRAPNLPALVRDVVDIARARTHALTRGALDGPLDRLRRLLDGYPTKLDLPTDRPRQAVADDRGAALTVRVAPDVAAALAAAGRRSGATPFMVVLAGWALLLARISGRSRLLVGTPVAARENAVEEAVIGYLSNTIAVPVDVGAAPSFGALVLQVRDHVLETMSCQQVPFEKLVEALSPPRSRATTPLVQALFAMQPRAVHPPQLDGLRVSVLPRHNEAARYELTLNVETTDDKALEGPLTYAAALFDQATIASWIDGLQQILRDAPAMWDAPLDSVGAKASAVAGFAAAIAEGTDAGSAFATPAEQTLANIWKEVLQTAPTRGDDDFFLLGGHSLLLMRVVNRVNASGLGHLDLADALGATSLSAMAALIDGTVAPPIAPEPAAVAADEVLPATSGQQGVWLARGDDPTSTTWSVPSVIRLPDGADAGTIRRAIERLIARHPSLRTTFVERDGVVHQCVAATGTLELAVHEDLDAEGRREIIRRELARPFDLVRGPLYRFQAFTGRDPALFVLADHSVVDGWSLDVLERDFRAFVESARSGRPPGLPELTTTPAAAAARADALSRQPAIRSYWQRTLRGLELGDPPGARTKRAGAPRRGRRTFMACRPETWIALEQLALSCSVTPTAALLASVAGLMARLKGDGREVSIGSPFAGRHEAEDENLVGLLAEVLPLRLASPLDAPFRAHVAATHRQLTDALAHQPFPLLRLLEELSPTLGGSVLPLDAVAVLDTMSFSEGEWFDPYIGSGKFDLCFEMARVPGGSTELFIDHDEDLYDEADALAMGLQLQSLIVDAANRTDALLGDLALIDDNERRWLTETVNATAADYPRDASMAELWQAAAARHADSIALTRRDGASVTYAGLDRRAETIGRALLAERAEGRVVALAVERGFDAVAAILGIWKAGLAYLPIDPKLPTSVVRSLMADADAHLVLADRAGGARLERVEGLRVLRLDALPPVAPGDIPSAPTRSGGDIAYVMFTSGTTGTPKGVAVAHRGIARLAFAPSAADLGPGDVMSQSAHLAFDATTIELWPALLKGATLRIVSDEELLDPDAFATAIRESGMTTVWMTTGLFCQIAEHTPQAFGGLRRVFTGGEVLGPIFARRVMDACPGVEIVNCYGPTENTCFTTTHAIAREDLDGPIPIGRPIANTRVYVVDGRLNVVPTGAWGELVCAGDGVAIGYAGRPDLTAAAFVTLPWGSGERVYRSGDIVRWRRDGVLEFGGRRDGQVKVRGHRIETGAIETALVELEGIRDAAVILTGKDSVDKALVACVVVDAALGTDPAIESVWRKRLADRLPLFMMPARFVRLPSMPMHENGKRDRSALAARVADLDSTSDPSADRSAQPRNDDERLVARLFAELFPGSEIDRHSDFLRLGGHSLAGMRLASRIEKEAGVRVAIRDLLSARTVAEVADKIRASRERQAPPGVAAAERGGDSADRPAKDDYPLSMGQERLWVVQRLFAESGAYNVPIAFEVVGQLDTAAFARAVTALEDRHHALRLVVTVKDGSPRQRLGRAGSLRPTVVDVTAEADPTAAAVRRQDAEIRRPFVLEREAGVRVFLFRIEAARWRILLVFHHGIVDGWSLGIILRDFSAFYARETGAAVALPPAPIVQFEQVRDRERRFAESPEGRAQLARWVQRLTPLPERLKLPTDRPRPPAGRFDGQTIPFEFDAASSAALDRLAHTEGVTPFALVTALTQVLLHRLTGQRDIAMGTLVAGRDHDDLHDTVGFIVNTLVLRQTIDPEASFRRLLSNTRAVCLQAVSEYQCPFGALVEALDVPRDPARTPLFDVLVVWQSDRQEPPALHGLETVPVSFAFPSSKFDVSFHFGRRDDRILCHVEYSSDLFDRQTIEWWFARLGAMAAAVCADPNHRVGALPSLSDAERDAVVRGFSDTATPLDTRRSIVRLLLDQTAAHATRPAVLWADDPPLDYARFTRRAGFVARRLVAAGVVPGQSVAVCAPRSPNLLAAIHGILMAGAAYAPLGPDDPAARIEGMLEDLGRPTVLASRECRDKVSGGAGLVLDLDEAGEADPIDLGTPDGLAYVIFTSGSTGRPKGVAIEHHSVLNRILWMQSAFPIGPDDVVLQKTPATFDVSVWELFWWAWTGAAVAVAPPHAERDPQRLVDLIDRHGVTVVHFVPSLLHAFLTCLEDGRADARRLHRLRHVFCSGEALDLSLVHRFNRALHEPFGTVLHNLYGPTEATVDVTWHTCSPWTGDGVVPIGRPVANTSIYVLDEAGAPTPIGVPGEIHIGGPQVARGYVSRPELTAERFVPNPFGTGRLYRTGDLGRWHHDGTVEYLGRLDRQVKVRGQRIEPDEVEHALEAHPLVERAAVVAVTALGQTTLHGYVLPRGAVTAAALRTHLRALVTEAMVPSRFFRLDSLPLTPSGKLDRRALTGTPLDGTEAAPAASLSQVEADVRAIWKALIPDANPASRDGFFDSGGNSLLVIALHERLNARWPGVFSVADLFACATIADQAARIAPRLAAAVPVPPVPSATVAPAATAPSVAVPQPPAGAPQAPGAAVREARGARAIAVVGMAVRLPGCEDLDAFWSDVSQGADKVRHLPPGREPDVRALEAALGLPPAPAFREAGYLDDVMAFDPRRLRMSPADAALLDPEQRLFLDTALRALEDAGRGGSALDDARVGVFVGGSLAGVSWRDAVMRSAPAGKTEQAFALNVPSNVATRLSFVHNWRGPAALVDTACSGSLVAIHHACVAIGSGECDWALVGGAKVLLVPPVAGHLLTIDSSTGRTRAFADGADGTGMGEGSVAFLLRPLDAALADGDAIHGVILGSAVNQDGASSGPAAPNPAAQAEVVAAAARNAGVALASLSYIEAHGTGTALGDPIEIEGLTRAFSAETSDTGFGAIGSAKGNYGHLDGAAGALGLARALMCLAHDSAPPQPFFDAPNARIDFHRSPVTPSAHARVLADRGCARRAGVSAFGLSGINAHVIVETPPAATHPVDLHGWVAVGLSAASAAGLRSYAAAVVSALRAHPEWPLADIARTLVDGRDGLDARLAVWVRDRGDLMARLAVFASAPNAVAGLVVTGSAARGRDDVAAIHDTEAGAEAAATAFVSGSRLTWPPSQPGGRVHLPPAPLERRRCAPDLKRSAPSEVAPGRLIGLPSITPAGRIVRLDVHSDRFWPVAEHRLNGEPTLVGMAFPALVAEAMPGEAVRIRDLSWVRPLRPTELEPGSVALSMATDGAVTLTGRTLEGRWLTFAKAVVDPLGASPKPIDDGLEPMDLPAATARCAAPAAPPPFARVQGALEVGDRWNRLDRVAVGPGVSIGWLRGDDADAGLRLDPALLDVATGLALAGPGMVPTGCGTVVIVRPLPASPVVQATSRETPDGAEADVLVADPATGEIAVAFLGLRFTRVSGAPPAHEVPLFVPRWLPSTEEGRDPGGPVVVIGEGGLCERLASYLATAGRLVARCGSGLVTPEISAAIGAPPAPVIVFAPSGGADVGRRAAITMRAILGSLRGPSRLVCFCEGAFAIDADASVDPFQAIVYGVVVSAAFEEPLLETQFVDTDSAAAPASLLSEIALFDSTIQAVAWRGGRRLVRTFVPIETRANEPPSWPTTGCCVVTGGTGGLALLLAESLAAGGHLSLALLSRSGAPRPEDSDAEARKEKLAALRTAGLRVELYACDVTDRASLAQTLDRVRRELGPITAVFHGAGVTDRGFLVVGDEAGSAFAATLAAKVTGACLLDELTANDPVEAFVMTGSMTGLLGSPGVAGYTGANAFLDTFAVDRRRRGKPAVTIDWCGIRGMGMAERFAAVQGRGISLGPDELPAVFWRAIAARVPQVVVHYAETRERFLADVKRLTEAHHPIVAASTGTAGPPDPAAAAPKGSGALEAALAAVWASVLGYDAVKADDDFYALGGDSISGMQIVEQIVRDLGHSMTLADLFESRTVGALAAKLRERTAQRHPERAGIPPAPPRDRYPVGWEQLAVLRSEEAARMGTAYNLPIGLLLPDDVDLPRFLAVLDALVQRHEVLRTRFVRSATEGGEPTMEVLPPSPMTVEEIDYPEGTDVVASLSAEVRPFDLWNGVPVRALIARVAGRPRALFFDIHHALADAFSAEALMADIAALYNGNAAPPPAAQLKDYAWWSREGGGAASSDEARAYWTSRFAGPLPVIDLPMDRPRPARHTWQAEITGFDVRPDLVARLRAFAAERRTTPFVVVTAAWSLLLARYARTEDVVISVPVDSRDTPGAAGMVGMMVSLLPLRLAVPPDARVGEIIDRAHVVHTEALRHRAFGLGRLLAELAPPAAPERALLSDVVLSYMNFADAGTAARSAAGLDSFSLMRRDGKADLSIYVRDLPDMMMLTIEYYSSVFDLDRIERMGRHFLSLLTAVVDAPPDCPIAGLPMVDANEAAWLESVGRGAALPASIAGRGLFEAFTAQVNATPDAIALEGVGVQLTFSALRGRACGVAGRLREAGVAPGDRVALRVERDANALVLVLGAVAAGAAYVPLDPGWPVERTSWVIRDAGCRLVIADAAGRTAIPSGFQVLDAESLAAADPAPDADPPATGTVYVMYTSGSTGAPKGVVVPQVGAVRMGFAGGGFQVTPADRMLQVSTLSFDASTIEIWTAWLNGARVCVASREEVLDPEALEAAIKRFGATVMWLTTGLFVQQVDASPATFAGMRTVWTGGDVASAAHLERAMRACPGVAFVNGYGPTENTGITTVHVVAPSDVVPGPIPIGRPVAETWVAVLEPSGSPAPVGVWGELVTGGLGLADGYLGRPDLTAERFVTAAGDPPRRYYRTGDMARWRADGVLEFGGRLDTQVKIRGFRVELEEIEHALNGHPAVAASAVLYVRDAGRLVACVQPTGDAPSSTALREWLSRQIPDYMVPRAFVVVPALPVTANGKVDRSRLAAMLPALERPPVTDADPPVGDAERLVAGVFSEIFGVPVNDRHARFLDLGGHSLLAIRVVNRIARETGVRLSMREFFVSPTVAGLAALVSTNAGEADSLARVPDAPTYPASHAQTRLYLASRMEAVNGEAESTYNMGLLLPAAGQLDLDALRSALCQLTARHETLRTGFEELGGEIVQRVAPVADPTVSVDDVSDAPDPEADVRRILRHEAAVPFDLASPPLLRARAIRVARAEAGRDEQWLVFVQLHHIVGDGWSAQILARELGACYRAAARGESAGLPDLPIAYRDFAAWQSRHDWTDAAAFWRTELAGAPHQIALPSERPVGAALSHRGETVTRPLPDALTQAIAAYARSRGASPASVGLSLFAGLLYRLTRQHDMVIGIGVAGRDRAEVEGLIGFFVNILPVRVRVSDETDFGSLVDQVHATMMAAMDHRDYPFDLLVRTLAPRRMGNRQPVVNVVYEYQRFDDLDGGQPAPDDERVDRVFFPGRPVHESLSDSTVAAIRTATAKHDLLLFHVERRVGSEIQLEFDTDILDRETALRWLGYLEQFATMAVGRQVEEPAG